MTLFCISSVPKQSQDPKDHRINIRFGKFCDMLVILLSLLLATLDITSQKSSKFDVSKFESLSLTVQNLQQDYYEKIEIYKNKDITNKPKLPEEDGWEVVDSSEEEEYHMEMYDLAKEDLENHLKSEFKKVDKLLDAQSNLELQAIPISEYESLQKELSDRRTELREFQSKTKQNIGLRIIIYLNKIEAERAAVELLEIDITKKETLLLELYNVMVKLSDTFTIVIRKLDSYITNYIK